MEVIYLEEKAFKQLVEELVQRVKEQNPSVRLDKWIYRDEAMHLLRIKSKTTLDLLQN